MSKPLKNELFSKNFQFQVFFHKQKSLLWLQNDHKYKQLMWNLEIFEKSRNIKAIKFNSFERKSINNNLCIDGKTIICVILKSSISQHNNFYDFEKDNKYRQKPKKSVEKCKNKVSKPLEPHVFL